MEIVLAVLAFVLIIIGILGSIIPVLPGPILSYTGLLVLRWSGYGSFSPVFLWIWAGITLVVTIMDFFLPSLMTKKFGGSRAASIGSFLGLVIGIFFFPPWGLILGSFLGAFIGELIKNSADGVKALKVALGAFLAFLVGAGAKLTVSLLMLIFAVRAILALL